MKQAERATENVRFAKRDPALLALLRQKMNKVEGAGNELHCPICPGLLDTYTLYGFVLDHCASCGGIWLDQGELESIVSEISAKFASGLAE